MGKFILGKSFKEKTNGITRENIRIVQTRCGMVFAYENGFDNPEGKYITVCPGFYKGELDSENGYRIVDLDMVPQESQPFVEEDLRKEGYRGEIKW